jgi:hypothetical protein
MNAGIALSIAACIVLLSLRFVIEAAGPRRRHSNVRRFKVGRVMVLACLVLIALTYHLNNIAASLDGQGPAEPGWLEKIALAATER